MSYSRNLNKLAAITLAIIIALLPIATANQLTGWVVEGATPIATLEVIASLPEYSRSSSITIEGKTKPGATLHVFVNDARQRVGNADSYGSFKFSGVALQEGENTVKIEPHEGTAVGTAKELKVIYDGKPPVVKLDKEIPASTTANSITVSGDVSEKVTIKYRNIHRTDTKAPDITGGLKASSVETNQIELAWDPTTAQDFSQYLIERNGKRIATSSIPSYKDTGLLTSTQYSYSVSAVDTSCNIGTSADILIITKGGKSNATAEAKPEINLSCETPYQTATAGSPFSITIPLAQGINDLEIIFEDSAGNRDIIRQAVSMDNAPPKFLETNLDKISPSYSPDITIKGKLDEQATVFVYINDEKKPAEYKVTDADGSFSIKTTLRTDVRIKRGATQTTVELGEGWANKIRLEAIDLAGNKAGFGPTDVDFLMCGSGTWWRSNVGEAMPSILLPRLMIQGIQQIGIPFNISYIGSNNAKLSRVTVRPIPLAPSAAADYDHNWVQVQQYTRAKGPKDLVGYVQIQFQNVDPLPEKPDAGPNERERALSAHRRGECLVPNTGCVKLFLQMEISFQEIVQYNPTDPTRPIVTPQISPIMTQKVCMPLEITIDQTIPNDIIPKGLLQQAVKLIGNAIKLIDKVLKPITTIGEYVLYGCLASNVWLLFNFFTEKMSCEASSFISVMTENGGAWNPAVAEAGMCEQVYKDEPTKQQKCNSCQSKIESRKKFELNVMHGLCDRVGCPSAPTFSTYIKGVIGDAEPLGDLSETVRQNDAAYFSKWQVGGTGSTGGMLYAGNDCAFSYRVTDPKKSNMDFITPTYKGGTSSRTEVGATGETASMAESTRQGIEGELKGTTTLPLTTSTVSYNKVGILELYNIANGKEPTTFPSGPKAEDCKKMLHPAHPNCCGIQYQKEWSSACGIGTVLGSGLDTFDELKQSTCLSAQQANENTKDLGCNSLWNSVAGFCESKTGEPSAQVVSMEAQWKAAIADATPTRPGADDNAVYLFVVPEGFSAGRWSARTPSIGPLGGGGTAQRFQIYSGYAVKTPQFQKMTADEVGFDKKNQLRLSAGLTAALETEVSECFGQQPQIRAEKSQSAQKLTEDEQVKCLYDKLCSGTTTTGYKISPCIQNGNVKNAWQKVNEIVGVPDQQYIVRPYSGLLRSIECICLPAVVSYLQMWRSVLGALHGCFSRILLTGEGSEGFCAAKLSSTICDLFFEAISCITQKFNAGGVGERIGGPAGFGDILSAMTGAGTAVSRSVNQRYGETSLYKSLFSERKLLHAICIWAFTGTWDLNVQGLFQQQVEEIPIDSSGALTTCERTFISYDPTTDPSGLTTWAYRIAGGLIAGADVTYRLKLKCSSGYNCDPRDYADGKCDCTSKEQSMYISAPELGNGRVRKFDLLNFDAPFVVSPQNSIEDASYRYDTAVLEWDWTDPQSKQVRTDKAECAIRETNGGNAPAFCALDAFSGRFRCLFGEQDSGIKIEPKAAYPENQNSMFALKDNITFDISVNQKFPQERRFQPQAKKFLTYEIRDSAGNVIDATLRDSTRKLLQTTNDEVSEKYTLESNGKYTLRIPTINDATPLGSFELNAETIARHSATGPTSALPLQRKWGISTLQDIVTLVSVRVDGQQSAKSYMFLINFPNYGKNPSSKEAKYEIYRVTSAIPMNQLEPDQRGWLKFTDGQVLFEGQQSAQSPTNQAPFTFTVPTATAAGTTPAVGTIIFNRADYPSAQALQVLVSYTPPATGASAAAGCNSNTVVTWRAFFTVYDADKQGGISDQISTDPISSEQQKYSVAFSVRCASKEALQGEAKATTAGAPTQEQTAAQLTQLNDILKGIITTGTNAMNELKTAATGPNSQGSKILEEIIKREKAERDSYITVLTKVSVDNKAGAGLIANWNTQITALERSQADITSVITATANKAREDSAAIMQGLINYQTEASTILASKIPSAAPAAAAPSAPATAPSATTIPADAQEGVPTLEEVMGADLGQILTMTYSSGWHQVKFQKLPDKWQVIATKRTPDSEFSDWRKVNMYLASDKLTEAENVIWWKITTETPPAAAAASRPQVPMGISIGTPTAQALDDAPTGQWMVVTVDEVWHQIKFQKQKTSRWRLVAVKETKSSDFKDWPEYLDYSSEDIANMKAAWWEFTDE